MRLSIFLILAACFQVSASGFAQITISARDESLSTVIKQIEAQTDYDFLYSFEFIESQGNVTLFVENVSLDEALAELLKNTSLTYIIVDKTAIIRPKAQQPAVAAQPTVNAERPITGSVRDRRGNPIPNVTIVEKGTTRGVMTDSNGNYAFTTSVNSVFVFSFLGYVRQEITVTNEIYTRRTLDVVMDEDIAAIEDVVITGFVDVNRMDMVGSYETLKMDEIYNPAYTSIEDMLQGHVGGLLVTRSSTRPGTSPNLLLRGTGTIIGNSAPLWVIDGIEQPDPIPVDGISGLWSSTDESNLNQYIGSQISWLNPLDIESVTVLKDASATAIYGSRAANGVMVITTKRAVNDTFNVNFNTSVTIEERPSYDNFSLMNSQERINFSKEAYDSGIYYYTIPKEQTYTYEGLYRMFVEGSISEDYFREQYRYLETINTDWFDVLTRNAVTQQYNLSMSGGTSKVNFTASLGYSDQRGIEIGAGMKRLNGRLAVNYRASPKINFSFNLSGTQTTTDGFTSGVNPLAYAQQTSRAIPVRDDNGNLIYYKTHNTYTNNGDTQLTGLNFNILNERDNSSMEMKNQQLSASMSFRWNIIEGLLYTFTGGYSQSARNSENYAGERTQYITRLYRGYEYGDVVYGSGPYNAAILHSGGELAHNSTTQSSYSMRNLMSYNKSYNGGHRMSLSMSWDIQSSRNKTTTNTVWGYDADRGQRISAPVSPENIEPHNIQGSGSWRTGYGILGQLYSGRWYTSNALDNKMSLTFLGTYSYKERYVFNFNGRNDWSNRFGQNVNSRFDPTYSFGVGWNIHNESFLKEGQTWLNELRLNATYGIQGNALRSQTPEMLLSKGGYSNVYGAYSSSITKLRNEYLDYEKTKTWNFQLGAMMFNGRFDMRVNGYIKTSDAMANLSLEPEYGPSSLALNGVIIRNTGFDVTATVVPYLDRNWKTSISLNMGRNWNNILKVTRQNAIITNPRASHYLAGQTTNIFEPGKPYSGFWSYSFAGLDPESGYPTFNYLDLGEDYTGDITDFLTYSGVKIAPIDFGFSFNVGYKAFTLSAHMAAQLGNKSRLPDPYSLFSNGRMPDETLNLPKELTDRWKQSGDEVNTDIPGLFTGINSELNLLDPNGASKSMYTMWSESNTRIVSGSFLRCRSLQLSWFSRDVVWEKIGLKSLTLSFGVNNVFLLADKAWKGMDPELNGTQVMPRSYTFSVNFGF